MYKYHGGSAALDPPYATAKTANLLTLGVGINLFEANLNRLCLAQRPLGNNDVKY